MARLKTICALAFASQLLSPGCADEPGSSGDVAGENGGGGPTGPSLQEPLGAGQVRGGRVSRAEELLPGPRTKGRLGDFKLYNQHAAFIIEDARASDGFYPWGGGIADVSRIGADGQPGPSYFGEVLLGMNERGVEPISVELVADGSEGDLAHVRVIGEDMPFELIGDLFETVPLPGPLQIDYVLRADSHVLEINFSYANSSASFQTVSRVATGFLMGDGAQPYVPKGGFALHRAGSSFPYYAAVAEEVGYAWKSEGGPMGFLFNVVGIVLATVPGTVIAPEEVLESRFRLAVGPGDVSALESLLNDGVEEPPRLLLPVEVSRAGGEPLSGARVHALSANGRVYLGFARADAEGRASLRLLPGEVEIVAVSPDGRSARSQRSLEAGEQPPLRISLPADGELRFQVHDRQGRALPCRIDLESRSEQGFVALDERLGEASFPEGLARRLYAPSGEGRLSLLPGTYGLTALRGVEYSYEEAEIVIVEGQLTELELTLERVVDTSGYLSGDFHLHASPSPDSNDPLTLKVAALAGEGVELPVSTDHEVIADWGSAVTELGLEGWLNMTTGEEVTTFVYGHFNVFPLVVDPQLPNGGGFRWFGLSAPELFATIREGAPPGHVIQINHPRASSIGGWLDNVGFLPATGSFSGNLQNYSLEFDAMEVSGRYGESSMRGGVFEDWLGLIGRGVHVTATGNSDSHAAIPDSVGSPRNFIELGEDDPRAVDSATLASAVLQMRNVVSSGPFVRVQAGDAHLGDTVSVNGDGEIEIQVEVSAPAWMDVDIVQVLVNGELAEEQELAPSDGASTRFDGSFVLRPVVDGHIIVAVEGDQDMSPWQPGRLPYAFTNPIFVDVDGDGAVTPPLGPLQDPVRP